MGLQLLVLSEKHYKKSRISNGFAGIMVIGIHCDVRYVIPHIIWSIDEGNVVADWRIL